MIAILYSEAKRFNDTYPHSDRKTRASAVDNFVNSDVKKISWSYNVKQELIRGKVFEFEEACLTQSLYRPFTRQWLYHNRIFNDGVYQIPCISLIGQAVENRVIQITGIGVIRGFSVLMSNALPHHDAFLV
ncbi:putative helicase [Bartonella heixiaziensis]